MMNDHVKVLIVGHYSPAIHGQSIQYAQLIAGAKEWDDVKVQALNAVYALSREDLSGFSLGKLWKMGNYAVKMCIMARKQNSNIIVLSPAFHVGAFLKDSVFIFLAKYVCRAKVVAWIHMDPNRLGFEAKPKWFQKYSLCVVNQLDLLVSCAPSLAGMWPHFLANIPTVSVTNGISDIAGNKKRPYSLSVNNKLKIGYLSAMDKGKGWRNLLNAVAPLCKEFSNLEVHFYGGAGVGESRPEIKQIFTSHPNHCQITWHEDTWGEAKEKAFQEMDLYCFPSHTEAFPLSILEAMQFALPIVSSEVGAVKDAVISDQGGWLCKPDDDHSLVEALATAISHRERWQAMGLYNRRRYEEQFSSAAFVENWYRLFRDILKS